MSYSVRYFTFRMDGFLSTVLCCNFLSTVYRVHCTVFSPLTIQHSAYCISSVLLSILVVLFLLTSSAIPEIIAHSKQRWPGFLLHFPAQQNLIQRLLMSVEIGHDIPGRALARRSFRNHSRLSHTVLHPLEDVMFLCSHHLPA